MKKVAFLIAAVAVIGLSACQRKNPCPAFGKVNSESVKRG